MKVVYDAAVLIAADRNDRNTWSDHRRWLARGFAPIVPATVVAQVSRSPRQLLLRRFLKSCEVVAFTPDQGHEAGALLSRAGVDDVVDAHVVLTAASDDSIIVTGDTADVTRLVEHARGTIVVTPSA